MWLKWTLIGLQALGSLISVSQIGKERKPVTKQDAIMSIVVSTAIIVGLLHYWQ